MKKSKFPKTDSIEKLAQFWHTHDLTDFEDELEEVAEPVFVRGSYSRILLFEITPGEGKGNSMKGCQAPWQ